ncbi:hypothetical protein B0T18DRAFT_164161 [Schizothecium vesticola]|uniref:Uncharacterized protein n=1 Tax=Schizothecium vesticola TaxID=314040 RepID=A0AA40EWU0_9PEZI|nr:hypothetical protein B0T18DRAFT_164161 [Schizothecium vesticola]
MRAGAKTGIASFCTLSIIRSQARSVRPEANRLPRRLLKISHLASPPLLNSEQSNSVQGMPMSKKTPEIKLLNRPEMSPPPQTGCLHLMAQVLVHDVPSLLSSFHLIRSLECRPLKHGAPAANRLGNLNNPSSPEPGSGGGGRGFPETPPGHNMKGGVPSPGGCSATCHEAMPPKKYIWRSAAVSTRLSESHPPEAQCRNTPTARFSPVCHAAGHRRTTDGDQQSLPADQVRRRLGATAPQQIGINSSWGKSSRFDHNVRIGNGQS